MRSRLLQVILLLLALLPAIGGTSLYLLMETGVLPLYVFVPHDPLRLSAVSLVVGAVATIGILTIWWASRNERNSRASFKDLATNHQKLIGEQRRFLDAMDHELKNPIQVLNGSLDDLSEALATRPPAVARARASLATSRNRAEYLTDLALNLRELVKLEDLQTIDKSAVNIDDVIVAAEQLALATHPGRQIKKVIQSVPVPPTAFANARYLRQALRNLFDNALKYSDPDKAIEVAAFDEGTYVTISVTDDGQGIPADDLPHVPERLYRSQKTRGQDGHGLGLSFVREIVRLHGAEWHIESPGPGGRGTRVILRLPAGNAMVATADEAPGQNTATANPAAVISQ